MFRLFLYLAGAGNHAGELGPERLASGEAPLVISSDTVDAPSGIESAVIDPALKRKFAASVNAQHTQSAASPAADHEASAGHLTDGSPLNQLCISGATDRKVHGRL